MDFKIKLYANEGLEDMKNSIFPPHFLMGIAGKPGSGKTSLLKHLLKSDIFFFKKFDYVFIISPSVQEYKSFFLPPENMSNILSLENLQNIVKNIKKKQIEKNLQYSNSLIILDDCIARLDEIKNQTEILEFIYNRRHLINFDGKDKGMVSIIITTQKFNKLSTSIRSNLTCLIFFKLNPIDYKRVYEDVIYGDKEDFENITQKLNFESDFSNFIIYRVDKNKYFFNFDEI